MEQAIRRRAPALAGLKESGQGGRDICKSLDNADLVYIVKNLKCKDGEDAGGAWRKGNDYYKVEFDLNLCSPPAPASELATVILHEPPKGKDGCRAKDVSETCK